MILLLKFEKSINCAGGGVGGGRKTMPPKNLVARPGYAILLELQHSRAFLQHGRALFYLSCIYFLWYSWLCRTFILSSTCSQSLPFYQNLGIYPESKTTHIIGTILIKEN